MPFDEPVTAGKAKYQGPLAGLNVIDFGHYYAGPMAAMMLADQGANVIRIVKPGEQELPQQQYRLLNRNKKLLELDLKTDAGKAQAKLLIEKADVLIENFRPGVMKRLELDYASLKTNNPGLIYLSLPGFASTDKERCHLQAWEGILGAAACAFTQTSPIRQSLGFPPVYTRVPQCSTYGAVCGVTAIMAALVARETHGLGTVIETPLVNAGLSAVMMNFASVANNEAPNAPVSSPLAYATDDSPAVQMEKLHKAMQALSGLGSKSFICADGREIYVSTYLTGQFIERFLQALGIDKQLKREGFVNAGPWDSGLDNNMGNTFTLSAERAQRFTQLIADAVMTKMADEWENLLAKAGIPAAVIRTREEYLALEPMLNAGVLIKQGDDNPLTVPGRLGDVSGPGDTLINHYREAEVISADKAKQLFNNSTPRTMRQVRVTPLKKGELLKGLKILDFCNVVAGPTSSHTLAEYGAEVIKAESPNGVHPVFLSISLELNQGKRSIVTDLKTAPGRDVFRRLVSWADVVVHNVLDDTAKRLGISQEQLREINPKVVSCQLSGNGGTWRGSWEQRPSFDNLIQGQCGLLAQYGTLEQPLWHGMISSADTIGGYSMAFTSLLAVYQQRRTGYAAEARTSLIRATNHYQLPHMIAENGKSDWGEAKGQFSLGESFYQRMYQCSDGWLYVGTTEDRASQLSETVTGQQAADEKKLEAVFVEQDCTFWLTKLKAADIACHRVLSGDDVRANASVRQVDNEAADEIASGSDEMLRWGDHPCGSPVARLALETTAVGEHHSWKRLSPAPSYGQQTREILTELGYGNDEIAELIRLKISHEYLPGIGRRDKYFFSPDHQE